VGWSERPAPRKPTFQDLDSELSSFLDVPERRRGLLIQPEIDLTHQDPIEEIEPAEDPVSFFESVRPARDPHEFEHVAREPTGKTVLDPLPEVLSRPQASSPPSSPAGARARQGPFGSSPAAVDVARQSERVSRAPSLRPVPRGPRPPSEFPRPPRSKGLVWGALLLLLSAGIVVATLKLRPDVVARLQKPDALDELTPPAPKQVVKQPVGGDLVVRVTPERSQILRFVGRGPVNVPNLPQGIAHEFVALADDAAPARLLVPKDAEWEQTPDGPRYEAAMQLSKAPNVGAMRELGETLLPQDVGSPSSTLGTVRIVTTPKGAKVYQVIGFAPEAKVENLPLDATQELLIYRKGYTAEIKVVAPSDYVVGEGAGGRNVAALNVALAPAPKR
jgi:hypothetical protein